jgi:hypothetical protein
MGSAALRCRVDSLAVQSCAQARGSGLGWTLRWQAALGLLLCTVLLAWWGYYRGRGPGIGGRTGDLTSANEGGSGPSVEPAQVVLR